MTRKGRQHQDQGFVMLLSAHFIFVCIYQIVLIACLENNETLFYWRQSRQQSLRFMLLQNFFDWEQLLSVEMVWFILIVLCHVKMIYLERHSLWASHGFFMFSTTYKIGWNRSSVGL